jgi:hypothetical protein
MNRQMLLDHLALAESRVAMGDVRLERERASIEERRRNGLDVKEAERLLRNLEQSQRIHRNYLDVIRKALAQLD